MKQKDLKGVVVLKEYVSPKAEFIAFKGDSVIATSGGCRCYGDRIVDLYVPAVDNDCESITWDQEEVIETNDLPPWY